MKLIIDIPEELYNRISEPTYDEDLLRYIITNGTTLPKGHGRLIDMKNLQNFVSQYTEHDAVQLILADREDYLPTIIEAESEEEDADSN